MVLQYRILWRLAAAAGLWICASAAAAAPQAPAFLPAGSTALPPVGFVDFCARQPQDCGPDAARVLDGVRLARTERAALLTPIAFNAQPASVGEPAPQPSAGLQLLPADEPLSALVEAAERPTNVEFIDPSTREVEVRVAQMTPDLWKQLNRINTSVNGAIRRQADPLAWGREDVWSTPIKDGRPSGDCEDYVLEKRRALLDAGIPARALNIAVVTTSWGETHAVLLVATQKGEVVLDNLSPWVMPWQDAPYRWGQRQVDGEAFSWAMAAPRPRASKDRMLIAALR